ncbi:hypothetical protein F2P81_003782 [Scophthalmus maximus]|uniref:Uncharacterized protein n=1 Tax=Scophthalmus maximus TaxID=52904 RepID=A0A6A4TN02_SCOMX|nr:hypothetical protein F2P81_003782 [Scophthalmus maximus]
MMAIGPRLDSSMSVVYVVQDGVVNVRDILRVFCQISYRSLRAAEDAVRPVSRASRWTAKCGSVSLKKSDFMTRHQNTIRFLLAE